MQRSHPQLSAVQTRTSTHSFPTGRVVLLLPSPWVGLRQGCLFIHLPTGFGACLLPALSVPLPRPDLVDFSKLTKSNANYNLQRAFRTAEQHLGLARLLDPEGELCMAPAQISSWGTPSPSAIPNSTPSGCSIILNPKAISNSSSLPSPSPSSSPVPPPSHPHIFYFLYLYLRPNPISIPMFSLTPLPHP